jgi:hypothetical protein
LAKIIENSINENYINAKRKEVRLIKDIHSDIMLEGDEARLT